MGEVVNVVVAFAVIFFFFRWITSGSDGERSPADILGFRPKTVSQDMIDTVSNMFPDIPTDNIRYDLLRTGSVETTTNKILERGFLDPPPNPYYTLYPRDPNSTRPNIQPAARLTPSLVLPQESLLSRYQLHNRVSEKIETEEVGGKAIWETSAEAREASLRERKAKMVLAARQRMVALQEKEKAKSSGS